MTEKCGQKCIVNSLQRALVEYLWALVRKDAEIVRVLRQCEEMSYQLRADVFDIHQQRAHDRDKAFLESAKTGHKLFDGSLSVDLASELQDVLKNMLGKLEKTYSKGKR